MYKHILIPTDGSPLSKAAIRKGVKLAKALGARVTGFFAAPPATPVIYEKHLPVGYATPEEHARIIEKAAAEYLEVIGQAAKRAGVPCKVAHVTDDFPAEAIVAAAFKHKCDLIFMASHGHRGFRDSMLGSQTHKVLAHSKIPVLVTH